MYICVLLMSPVKSCVKTQLHRTLLNTMVFDPSNHLHEISVNTNLDLGNR